MELVHFPLSEFVFPVAMDELHPQDNEQHSYVLVTGANRLVTTMRFKINGLTYTNVVVLGSLFAVD